MLDNFIEYMKNDSISKNTYENYASDVEQFKKYYQDSYGEELTTLVHADISMYSNFLLKNNYSPKSVNRKLSALKLYNRFLISEKIQNDIVIVDRDYIKIKDSGIMKKIPTGKEINKLKHFSSKDEKNSKRDYCFMVLLMYGGLRERELVSIIIDDVKMESRYINIIGKGKKFRQVVINNLMYDALNEYMEERENMNIKNPYLFIGQKNQNTLEPLNRNFCNRLLNKYKELCKINDLCPHLLRAFFCSNALHKAGYSIDQVAAQAGHSSLNTTKGYLVTEQDNLLSLSNKL